jgi:hypothetical protein
MPGARALRKAGTPLKLPGPGDEDESEPVNEGLRRGCGTSPRAEGAQDVPSEATRRSSSIE